MPKTKLLFKHVAYYFSYLHLHPSLKITNKFIERSFSRKQLAYFVSNNFSQLKSLKVDRRIIGIWESLKGLDSKDSYILKEEFFRYFSSGKSTGMQLEYPWNIYS